MMSKQTNPKEVNKKSSKQTFLPIVFNYDFSSRSFGLITKILLRFWVFAFTETAKREDEQSTFVDPSYTFSFRTPDYQRREDADSLGRVRGLYSFIDDVGEKHLVRYAASADRGFEVLNSVPDASRYVQYSAPLYKTAPKVRGRIAYERGPGRQYKFISSGPDQRRMETTGNDGITRGAYSYLDDKGVQRTTQYIAGAGIGYRIVQATTGPGTHLLPRPALVEFGILYPPGKTDRADTTNRGGNRSPGNSGGNGGSGSGSAGSGFGAGGADGDDVSGNSGSFDDSNDIGSGGGGGPGAGSDGNKPGESRPGGNRPDGGRPTGNRPPGNRPGGNRNDDGAENNGIGDDVNSGEDERFPDNNVGSARPSSKGGRDFLIINNKGRTFFGIPPGKSARAHVQNIDLVPFGDQAALSPSERLRLDENAARHRPNRRRYRGWNRIVD